MWPRPFQFQSCEEYGTLKVDVFSSFLLLEGWYWSVLIYIAPMSAADLVPILLSNVTSPVSISIVRGVRHTEGWYLLFSSFLLSESRLILVCANLYTSNVSCRPCSYPAFQSDLARFNFDRARSTHWRLISFVFFILQHGWYWSVLIYIAPMSAAVPILLSNVT